MEVASKITQHLTPKLHCRSWYWRPARNSSSLTRRAKAHILSGLQVCTRSSNCWIHLIELAAVLYQKDMHDPLAREENSRQRYPSVGNNHGTTVPALDEIEPRASRRHARLARVSQLKNPSSYLGRKY
jgi:hypothetical protein